MSKATLPLRIARREVWRRPGRTALVALLVALPVAAMAMSVVLIRTDHRTTALDEWERENGQADAAIYGSAVFGDPIEMPGPGPGPGPIRILAPGPGPGPVQDRRPEQPEAPEVNLPDGSRVVHVVGSYQRVRTVDGHRSSLEVRDLPLLDPITAGIHDLVEGRAATEPGEVVLGVQAARSLQVDVGDDLVLDHPDLTLQVVGLVEPVGCLSCPVALVAPGELDVFPDAFKGGYEVRLVDLPDTLTDAQLAKLADDAGDTLVFRDPLSPSSASDRFGASDAGEPVRWSLVVGALVLTVAGIVISAAFAVGARRKLVTLGQLSASGVSPSTVRAALVLQGTVTGVVGALTGLVIATTFLLTGQGFVEKLLDERIDSYTVRATDVVLAVLIGIGAATVAALIPARSAARIPTLAALAGRRPLAPVSRRVVSWGLVAMVGGLGLLGIAVVGSQSSQSGQLWTYVAILGGVGELLGACAIAPAIVARLEPLAARLRGSWRLGARSLARHRSRTGAVVSAVAAAGALAIAAGALIQGMEARYGFDIDVPDDVVLVRSVTYDDQTGSELQTLPATPTLRADLTALFPGVAETILQATPSPIALQQASPDRRVWWEAREVADPDEHLATSDRALLADAATLDLLRASTEMRDALAEVGVVVIPDRPTTEAAVVTLPDSRSVDAVAIESRTTLGYGTAILVSPARAEELDLTLEPLGSAFQVDHALSTEERDQVEDLMFMQQQDRAGTYTEMRWNDGPSGGPSPFQVELILSGLALAFSLFVVSVSLALAAAESRDERDVLTIAGAPPGTLARSAGARAWLLAGLGGAMAIPVGFLPVVVFSRASSDDTRFPLIFPSGAALALLVVVPAVVALAAWGASATAQRVRPVRVSTATFE